MVILGHCHHRRIWITLSVRTSFRLHLGVKQLSFTHHLHVSLVHHDAHAPTGSVGDCSSIDGKSVPTYPRCWNTVRWIFSSLPGSFPVASTISDLVFWFGFLFGVAAEIWCSCYYRVLPSSVCSYKFLFSGSSLLNMLLISQRTLLFDTGLHLLVLIVFVGFSYINILGIWVKNINQRIRKEEIWLQIRRVRQYWFRQMSLQSCLILVSADEFAEFFHYQESLTEFT